MKNPATMPPASTQKASYSVVVIRTKKNRSNYFFFRNLGVVSGGSSLTLRKKGLITSFTGWGRIPFAASNTGPWLDCMGRGMTSGLGVKLMEAVAGLERAGLLTPLMAT